MKFTIETYADVFDEMQPLIEQHWREIAVHQDIDLDADYDLYRKVTDGGILWIYTVRDAGSNALIGYAVFFVRPHIHYSRHTWAINDIIWLAPEHRNIGTGRALVRFFEDDMRARKVDVVHINAKMAHPALKFLLQSEGYAIVGVELEKRL